MDNVLELKPEDLPVSIRLKCPDGTSKQATVSITPGQTHTEVIR